MHKIGIAGFAFSRTDENYESFKKSGLSATELTLHGNPDMDFKKEAERAARHGVTLWSCHMPFKSENDISSECEEDRKSLVPRFSEKIKEASGVGIKRFVIHPSGGVSEERREERKKCTMDTLLKLAPVAKECGAVICVENLSPSCLGKSADELLEIISVDDSLRICFDVNHLFCDTHEEFIKKLGHKIGTVHISDYDFTEQKHFWPGHGKINWPELYKMISDSGYNGVWMYEMLMEYNDFKGTFDELYNLTMDIFSGKQPNP